MLKFILGLFGRPNLKSGTRVRRWAETEPERVRTYEEITEITSDGAFSVSVSHTVELATDRQEQFLKDLCFTPGRITKKEASDLLTRILRPVDYALSKTFKNVHRLEREHLRVLQLAIFRWEYCPQLPRYGPYSTWSELEASGNDPNRPLTKEERMAVTEIAFRVLPAEVFRSLISNGVKKYKDGLELQR